MTREGTIGVAALLAVAATLGLTMRPGSRPEESGKPKNLAAQAPRSSVVKPEEERPGCSVIESQLKEFLNTDATLLPGQCYADPAAAKKPRNPAVLAEKTSQVAFVIATLPDPLHTHSSSTFDQLVVAIQEAAQDEKYDFDSAWLPWDDNDPGLHSLADLDRAGEREEAQEEQPGIILFRKAVDEDGQQLDAKLLPSYEQGLIVFVVGEDATHGIHREQFRNALRWIEALQPSMKRPHLGILGPSFSGSFPSLAQLLSEDGIAHIPNPEKTARLPIYSGSSSSTKAASWFQSQVNPGVEEKGEVEFHSFLQDDDEILKLFCEYLGKEQPEFDPRKIAVISEDQTAYGNWSGAHDEHEKGCPDEALMLFYPRDISALRGAYQTKSIFNATDTSGSSDAERRNLPTNLADPAGIVHDSIRSYGGNQTPLAQEASLLQIVSALTELHAQYILLRSSNILDQLFLTDFLRRMYPGGRIVIVGSDQLLAREHGTTSLSGTLTLSTYPLFPLERDWTEHAARPAADRQFSADTAEGTYVALRLLLNSRGLSREKGERKACHTTDDPYYRVFLPKVVCEENPPIPDYSLPHWMVADKCGRSETGEGCPYEGPALWLSVIGQNRFWPVASMKEESLRREPLLARPEFESGKRVLTSHVESGEPGETPEMPLGMKLFLIGLGGFAFFHTWCCWAGSYTAKPALRAHFANTGDWRQSGLVLIGSCLVATLGMLAGWGCGVFFPAAYAVMRPWFALVALIVICLAMWLAILAHSRSTWIMAKTTTTDEVLLRGFAEDYRRRNRITSLGLLIVLAGFFVGFIVPVEATLLSANRVMTYWRSMHLTSGVSPIVPLMAIVIGFYVVVWLELHGLALFGPDRPCLPRMEKLRLKDKSGKEQDFLRMFSQEDAADKIEEACQPVDWRTAEITAVLFVGFCIIAWALSRGVPVRSLGAQRYSLIVFLWLNVCVSLMIAKACQLYGVWDKLRRLLAFLDRLPLRRTMAALRGFSWGGVWKMSGNVLEVRYKVISRQLESMNHTISSFRALEKDSQTSGDLQTAQDAHDCVKALEDLGATGQAFAKWYSNSYTTARAGDLSTFAAFQEQAAVASGTMFSRLLVPAWRKERVSLILLSVEESGKGETAPSAPPLSGKDHIRSAEEFVCLTYLGFIQNILGRLRTLAIAIVTLFIAATVALSAYPFDPREELSAVLVVLFVVIGVVIVKVYAEMHRDATLSHVTNTRPGELGPEFWFKIVGFGFAPLIGLLTRIFPGITEFVFSWLQPGISSLK